MWVGLAFGRLWIGLALGLAFAMHRLLDRLLVNRLKIRSNSFATSNETQSYTPRRALLYVPADDPRKLAKINDLNADCVVLECEDGVAVNRKDEARRGAASFLKQRVETGRRFGEIGVRVNSLASGLLEDDMKVLSDCQTCLQALMVPKVDSVSDVRRFWELFTKYCPSARQPIKLIIWIESARALIDMPQILSAADHLRGYSPLRLDAAVFGSDDLCADLGATRSKEATELAYARQKFLLVCKAHRIQAIDMAFIDIKDTDGLRRQCEDAQRMGFTGKQVIHPGQVPVVQKAFLPSSEKVQWARDLLAEFSVHEKSGKGAFTFKGQMIDMPLVLQARNIVEMVDRITELEKSVN